MVSDINMQLPELVDGRDFFKRPGEVVGRAYTETSMFSPEFKAQHFYHSQVRKTRGTKNLVFCWTMPDKNNPGNRILFWIPEDQLVFY